MKEQHELLKGSHARTRHRALLKIFLGWGAIFLALGGAGYALVATDALAVASVRVEGVRLADHARVKTALAEALEAHAPRAWLGSGLMPFWLFAEPPAAFREAFPMFRAVTIAPRLFAREVVIEAEERELYGVWCVKSGACYAFDREGIAFGSAPRVTGALVTKVEDAREAPLAAGDPVLAESAWRANLLRTLAVVRAAHLAPRAITVLDLSRREWEVVLTEGPVLKFSFAFVPERLADALASLARRADFRSLTYLDFRVPDRLFYK